MERLTWLSFHDDVDAEQQWDSQFIKDLFSGKFGDIGYRNIGDNVVVIPARHHAKDINEINDYLAKLDWCLVILIGDEASVFPWDKLKHPNMRLWVMDPKPGFHEELSYTINGYPPQMKEAKRTEKTKGWFFAGQGGHTQRQEMFHWLKRMNNGELIETEGFTQGLDHETYYQKLAESKVALCPSGPNTPDTFRLWEALELGCVPIVNHLPSDPRYPDGFWSHMLGVEPPFVFCDDWNALPQLVNFTIQDWRSKANECDAWFQGYKRQQVKQLQKDLFHLSGYQPGGSRITTLIPTSPIPSNPSTHIIDQTIDSVKERLPDSEIIIMIDGVRPEQLERKKDYDEYVTNLLTKYQHDPLVTPLYFDQHTHQVGMTRKALEMVDTPYIQFVEQDTPLMGEIPYSDVLEAMNDYNLIRFHHEASILEPHKHMMLDEKPIGELPVVRTVQFSARPHVAKTEFYRWILHEYFKPGFIGFIEDDLYGVVIEEYKHHGFAGWEKFKLAIYHPEGEHGTKRSTHTDGRAGDPKFDGVGS